MRVKPWPILIIAFIHIFAPLFNILWSASMNGVSVSDYIEYISYNQHLLENVFWYIIPMIAGFSILRFRRWSYTLIVSFTLLSSALLAYEFWTSPQYPLPLFALFELTNLAVFTYFLLPAVRNVYLNKNLRWWEQQPRYLIDHQVELKYKDKSYSGIMRNISEGGCLMETAAPVERQDSLLLVFDIFQKKIQTESQVVFKGREGVGVFFTTVYPSQNDLNKLIQEMANQGFPLRTPRPKWNESLREWILSLLKGKGFVPQLDTKDSVVIRSTPKKPGE